LRLVAALEALGLGQDWPPTVPHVRDAYRSRLAAVHDPAERGRLFRAYLCVRKWLNEKEG
jgi:hypothetical protein